MKKYRLQVYRTQAGRASVVVAIAVCVAACSTLHLQTTGDAESDSVESTAAQVTTDNAAYSIWHGVYTDGQAKRGEAIYRKECAECHREDLRGQEMAPGLVGVAFSFRWRGLSLNDLFTGLRYTMPQAMPGSLTAQSYVDLVAYLLSVNGYPAGDEELSSEETTLAQIVVEREQR